MKITVVIARNSERVNNHPCVTVTGTRMNVSAQELTSQRKSFAKGRDLENHSKRGFSFFFTFLFFWKGWSCGSARRKIFKLYWGSFFWKWDDGVVPSRTDITSLGNTRDVGILLRFQTWLEFDFLNRFDYLSEFLLYYHR